MKVEEIAEKSVSFLLKSLSMFDKFDPSIGSMEISIKVFPIRIENDYSCFVATGTKDKPTGVSNTDANYVLLFKSQDEYQFIEIAEFKKKLAAVWSVSEKKIDPEFSHMGALCYYKDFI